MIPLDVLLVGAANFIFIFLKAFQQRNVAFMHYWWVVPTSLLMGIVEVGVVGAVAIKATAASSLLSLWPIIIAIGVGGGLGAVASMWIHKRYIGDSNAEVRRKVQPVRPRVGSIQSIRRSGGVSGVPFNGLQDTDAEDETPQN
jgi:hypothetical protein